MNFSIEGIDDVVDKLTQYASGDKIQRGLAMAGAHAVANCPVATGRLRGSIVSQVDGDSVAIGPTADYGIYVEFGTGTKGDKSVSHTSKRHWTYYSGGRFYTTSGQAPQPALKNNVSEIVAKFKEGYGV